MVPGEPAGFRDFVVTASPRLLRTAWLLSSDWASAEDLLQTSLAKAWPHWPRVSRTSSPEAYVLRIVHREAISRSRRRWTGERPAESVPERASRAFEDASDLRIDVARAVSQLPPRQRAVVILRYFDDFTEAQIADVLGCSLGTVKSQASKALAKLRPQLEAADNKELQ